LSLWPPTPLLDKSMDRAVRGRPLRVLRVFVRLTESLADEIGIDTMERALRNVGRNRTEHRAIADARHAGDVPPWLRDRWTAEADALV
jgi:hypothetical protein